MNTVRLLIKDYCLRHKEHLAAADTILDIMLPGSIM